MTVFITTQLEVLTMKYIKTLKAIYLFVFLNLPFQVFSQASDGVVVDEIIGRIDDYIVLRLSLIHI